MKNYAIPLFLNSNRFFLLLVLMLNNSFGQGKTEILTNQTVVSLVKVGLDKSIIITTINNSESKFDLSANGLLALKKQGVVDEILIAMSSKSSVAFQQKQTNLSQNKTEKVRAISQNGLSSLESGIYYVDETNNQKTELEASVFSQSKTGSGILTGLTYGIAKTKSKAVLSGTQANFQIKNHNPIFYFIFPQNGGGSIGNEGSSGMWFSNTSSPNEFMLVKFKVVNSSKQKGREVVTGSFGSYSGFSGGIDDANKVPYRFTKVSPNVYKVYFETPITAGEYAFIFAGTAATVIGGTTSQKAFDFSVTQ